jgi:hypothetical protein
METKNIIIVVLVLLIIYLIINNKEKFMSNSNLPPITLTGNYYMKLFEQNNVVLYDFYGNGSLILNEPKQINFFIVGGGGGGSGGNNGDDPIIYAGTGGNSGYVLQNSSNYYTLPAGEYNIQIGTGGIGGSVASAGLDGTSSILALVNKDGYETIIALANGGKGGKYSASNTIGNIMQNENTIAINTSITSITTNDSITNTYINNLYNKTENKNSGFISYASRYGKNGNQIGVNGHYYNLSPIFINGIIASGGNGGATENQIENTINYGDGGNGGNGGKITELNINNSKNLHIPNYYGKNGNAGRILIWYYK